MVSASLRHLTSKALKKTKYDAIVIGGGHNGLVAVSSLSCLVCGEIHR